MKRLIGLLAFVVVAGLALAWWRALQPMRAVEEAAWPSIDPVKVGEVRIAVPEEPVAKLVRRGEDWSLVLDEKKTPADRDAIKTLLDALAGMRIVRVVAHTNAHDASFGLDRKHAVHLELFDAAGKKIAGFWIGRQTSTDRISTYLRRDGDARVVAVDRALVWLVRRPAQDWQAPKNEADKGAKPSKGD